MGRRNLATWPGAAESRADRISIGVIITGRIAEGTLVREDSNLGRFEPSHLQEIMAVLHSSEDIEAMLAAASRDPGGSAETSPDKEYPCGSCGLICGPPCGRDRKCAECGRGVCEDCVRLVASRQTDLCICIKCFNLIRGRCGGSLADRGNAEDGAVENGAIEGDAVEDGAAGAAEAVATEDSPDEEYPCGSCGLICELTCDRARECKVCGQGVCENCVGLASRQTVQCTCIKCYDYTCGRCGDPLADHGDLRAMYMTDASPINLCSTCGAKWKNERYRLQCAKLKKENEKLQEAVRNLKSENANLARQLYTMRGRLAHIEAPAAPETLAGEEDA